MKEKIANSIAKHQQIINELKEIKVRVEKHIEDKVRFRVDTKGIFRSWEPYVNRVKNYIDITPQTMNVILDEAIRKEKERINKLIDMEIDSKLARRANKKEGHNGN